LRPGIQRAQRRRRSIENSAGQRRHALADESRQPQEQGALDSTVKDDVAACPGRGTYPRRSQNEVGNRRTSALIWSPE
jgi:hypothetical protein